MPGSWSYGAAVTPRSNTGSVDVRGDATAWNRAEISDEARFVLTSFELTSPAGARRGQRPLSAPIGGPPPLPNIKPVAAPPALGGTVSQLVLPKPQPKPKPRPKPKPKPAPIRVAAAAPRAKSAPRAAAPRRTATTTVRPTQRTTPTAVTSGGGGWRTAVASWYGPGFYGQRTACGQTYTSSSWGFAHKTLPCGTVVQFRNGGRIVSAPVIDRGPYTAGRTFDLSAALCGALGHCYTGSIEWRFP